MVNGPVVLSIGYGTAETAAAVVAPDGGWLALPVDGRDRVSNAVFLDPVRGWLTGERAWQAGPGAPDRFEVCPARWLRHPHVLLGGVPVPPWDLVTATLKHVADTATARLAGVGVGEVRLVVPAGWGPRRRFGVREAAHAAGLRDVTVVEAPVGVLEYLASHGTRFLVGTHTAVCDLDGGVEATVLRRTGYGFEVVSTIDAPDAGTLAWDAALAAHVTGVVAAVGGAGPSWPGQNLAVLTAARTAREAAATSAAVTVAVPGVPPVVLPAVAVVEVGRPLLAAAGKVLRQAVDAAELAPGTPVEVYATGSLTGLPGTVDVVAQAAGLRVSVADEPGWAAILGAAHATGRPTAPTPLEPPVPTFRRLGAAVIPAVASLLLIVHFVATARREHSAGIAYDPAGYLLADWGDFALAALFATIAALSMATVIAAALPTGDPFAHPGAAPLAANGETQPVGPALLAATAAGVAAAGVYAIAAAAFLQWPNGGFLRWAVLPLLPLAATVAVAAVLATRLGRVPAAGWHGWLNFPAASIAAATVGMVAVQVAFTAARYPATEFVLGILGHAGGALLGVAAAVALADRWLYRGILALPTGVLGAGIVAWQTTGTLAGLYVAAVTLWWMRRTWSLATRPATVLPRLR